MTAGRHADPAAVRARRDWQPWSLPIGVCATALAATSLAAMAVAPAPVVPPAQVVTAERPAEPTARASGIRILPTPTTSATPAPVAAPSTPGSAPTPVVVERDEDDCSRCGQRTPTAPTTPAPDSEPPVVEQAVPEQAEPAPQAAAHTPADPLLQLVNADRAAAGCPPVTPHPDLTAHAQAHADAQAADDTMRHSDGPAGFGTWGENVAAGYDTADAVHRAWMDSAGHRANILDCQFTLIGYGAADSDGVRYWTQVLAA